MIWKWKELSRAFTKKPGEFMRSYTLVVLVLIFAGLTEAQVSVNSNGFQHTVYWNAGDSTLYHVSTSGGVSDTHLVKHYRSRFLSTDATIDIGVSDIVSSLCPNSIYQPRTSAKAPLTPSSNDSIEVRSDTVFYSYKLERMSPVITLFDTLIRVHLGEGANHTGEISSSMRYINKFDYLVVNGIRCQVKEVTNENGYSNTDMVVLVEKQCPVGNDMQVNAVFRTLPCLKTLSRNQDYRLLADPNFQNKLFLFYISDSGRVISQVSWDNGLTWEEWYDARQNTIMTDSSGARSGLSASINSSGLITLSWTGNGSGTTLQAPASMNVTTYYINPSGNKLDDASSRDGSLSQPFNSMDRAFTAMIMNEKAVTYEYARLQDYGASGRDPNYTRAVASRSYVIKLLPGIHQPHWKDADTANNQYTNSTHLNRLIFPDWDRSLTIESYGNEVKDYAVIADVDLGGGYGSHYFAFFGSTSTSKATNIVNTYPMEVGHITLNKLKVTTLFRSTEEQASERFFLLPAHFIQCSNIRVMNSLFYSMDSTPWITYHKRSLDNLFGTLEISSFRYYNHVDNFAFVNNIFSSLQSSYYRGNTRTYPDDYSGGYIFAHNTFFNHREYWEYFNNPNYVFIPKLQSINNLYQGSCVVPQTSNFLRAPSVGNLRSCIKRIGEAGYVDTVFTDSLFYRSTFCKPDANRGIHSKAIPSAALDSAFHTDYYQIPRSASGTPGACLPGPANPLTLSAETDPALPAQYITISIDSQSALVGVDTFILFRDSTGYVMDITHFPDTAFNLDNLPASYRSHNLFSTRYYYTIAAGKKMANGFVNWTTIDTLLNSTIATVRDQFPPESTYYCDSTYVGSDTIHFRLRSPFPYGYDLYGSWRMQVPISQHDISRLWIYFGTDTTTLFNAISANDSSIYDTVFSFIDTVIAAYTDTTYLDSTILKYSGLSQNTDYFCAVVTQDSSGNFCRADTVRKHLSKLTTHMAPPNVLHISATTVSRARFDSLTVTLSGFSSLPGLPATHDSVKLFVRHQTLPSDRYVLDPSTEINAFTGFKDTIVNITGITGDTKVVGLRGLLQDTSYFLSVTIQSLEGFYSRIAEGVNTCSTRTLPPEDITPPDVSGLTLQVSNTATQPELNLQYKVKNLNTITGRDRDSLWLKVMWSTSLADVADPHRDILGDTIYSPAFLNGKDSISEVASNSKGIYPGHQYYFRAFARDSAMQWSLAVNNLLDSGTTPSNATRPLNNFSWDIQDSGFNVLTVSIPSEFSVDDHPETIDGDDIEGVGIWVLPARDGYSDTTNFNAIVDQGHPTFWVDSSNMYLLVRKDTLVHRTPYYVLGSPKNKFGNWGTVALGVSALKIVTPFDSTLVTRPVGDSIKGFAMTVMKAADSVKISFNVSSYQAYNLGVDTMIRYDSLVLYYRTDGTYPVRSGSSITGNRLGGFKIDPTHLGVNNVSLGGVNCLTRYYFSAFLVNEVPLAPKYINRYSDAVATAQAGSLQPPCAVSNQLVLDADVPNPTSATVRVHWTWTGEVSDSPEHILLLYRIPSQGDMLVPPTSYGDGLFGKLPFYNVKSSPDQVEGELYLQNLYFERTYLIAAYNGTSDTVWSTSPISTLTSGPWDTVSTPDSPEEGPQNELSLSATAVNSRTIRLDWSDPNGTLTNLKSGYDSLTILFGYKTNASEPYVWIPAADTGEVLSKDSLIWAGNIDPQNPVISNKTYYLVIAPANQYFAVKDTHALARDTITLTVPNAPVESLSMGPLSDTAFYVDYHLLNNQDPSDLIAQDAYLKNGLLLVSDTGIIDTNIFSNEDITRDIINGTNNRSGRGLSDTTFIATNFGLASTLPVKIGMVGEQIYLNKMHYVSFALLTDDFTPGKPRFVDSISYVLADPWFDLLTMAQINDSFIRVTFRANDAVDPELALKIQYTLNDTALTTSLRDFQSGNFRSGYYSDVYNTHIVPESTYTAYIRITSASLFYDASNTRRSLANTDTNTLSIAFSLSDQMGPVPAASDTLYKRSLIVDARPPSPANHSLKVVLNVDAPNQILHIMAISDTTELDTIRLSRTDPQNLDSIIVVTSDTTRITVANTYGAYMRFLDRFQNHYDTTYFLPGWNPGDNQGEVILPGESQSYNNGDFIISLPILTYSDTVRSLVEALRTDTVRYYSSVFAFPTATFNTLVSNGLSYANPGGYAIAVSFPKADDLSMWEKGITLSFVVDTTLPGFDPELVAVYKWNKLNGTIEYVGGEYDAVQNKLVIANQTFPGVTDIANATTSDSVFYFVSIDTAKVRIDGSGSTLTLNSSSDSLYLRFQATDNTVNLTAEVKLLAYNEGTGFVDLFSQSLSHQTQVSLDTAISIGNLVSDEAIKQGIFAAFWVTDRNSNNRTYRQYRYMRCTKTFDSVQVTYRDVDNQYQLLSLPYDLPEENRDILYVMKDYSKGIYDRERFRLFKKDTATASGIIEFHPSTKGKEGVEADPAFKVKSGESFFMIAREFGDKEIPLNILSATTPQINVPNKGFLLKHATIEGWYLCAAPFLGEVSLTAMKNVSVTGSTRPALDVRLFIINDSIPTLPSWEPVYSQSLLATDYAQGFAVYLYPGDSLIVPVVSNPDLLNYDPYASKSISDNTGWSLLVSLKDKTGQVIDKFNEVGISGNAWSLPDLPSLNKNLSFGILSEKNTLLCRAMKKDEHQGKIWTLFLNNKAEKASDYSFALSRLESLPEGWQVWVDDPSRGYASNLTGIKGNYGLYAPKGSSQSLKLVVGDKDFIAANITRTEPVNFLLAQNFPNPFNPMTTILYEVKDFTKGSFISETHVSLKLYNLRGQLVRTLVNDVANPGYKQILWNGHDDHGKLVASGIYLYRISIKGPNNKEIFTKTKQMIMTK